MFVRDKHLQPILKMEPARVMNPSGAQLLGKLLTRPTNIWLWLERLARDKHSSLFVLFVSYEEKRVHKIDPKAQFDKTFCLE